MARDMVLRLHLILAGITITALSSWFAGTDCTKPTLVSPISYCVQCYLMEIDVLNLLLHCSQTQSLPPEVWWGFLELPLEKILSHNQITTTFEILQNYFWGLRSIEQVCINIKYE